MTVRVMIIQAFFSNVVHLAVTNLSIALSQATVLSYPETF